MLTTNSASIKRSADSAMPFESNSDLTTTPVRMTKPLTDLGLTVAWRPRARLRPDGESPHPGTGYRRARPRYALLAPGSGLGPLGRTTSSGSVPSWLVLERGMVTTRP
jgi:hypothetical protein